MLAAGAVFIVSIALTATAYQVLNVHGFREMNTIANLEISTHTTPGGVPRNEPEVSPHKFVQAVLVLGILGMLMAGLAGLGAFMGVPCLLITFFFFTVGGGIFFAVMSMSSAQFTDVVEPVIARQVNMYCNATMYETYRAKMENCEPTVGPTQPAAATVTPSTGRRLGACGEECETRVTFLNKVGGCKFLQDTCGSYTYAALPAAGFCAIKTGAGLLVQAPSYTNKPPSAVPASSPGPDMTVVSCEAFCNFDTACFAYNFNPGSKECRLVTIKRPAGTFWTLSPSTAYNQGTKPNLIDMQHVTGTIEASAGSVCHKKTLPAHVAAMEDAASKMSIVTMVASFVFILSGIAACGYVFTVGTNKKGKKGAGAMAMKLLCPCLNDRKDKSKLVRTEDQSGTDYDIE